MKLPIILLVVALIGAAVLVVACKKRGSPGDTEAAVARGEFQKSTNTIIGFWRPVKLESSDSKYQNPTGELEMQFADGGVVTVKMRDPANGAGTTQSIEGNFTLTAPDRVNISLDGTTQERYRYLFRDGQLRMEHLDYPVTNTLQRLKGFSL